MAVNTHTKSSIHIHRHTKYLIHFRVFFILFFFTETILIRTALSSFFPDKPLESGDLYGSLTDKHEVRTQLNFSPLVTNPPTSTTLQTHQCVRAEVLSQGWNTAYSGSKARPSALSVLPKKHATNLI